jgi:hypothetical protein
VDIKAKRYDNTAIKYLAQLRKNSTAKTSTAKYNKCAVGWI